MDGKGDSNPFGGQNPASSVFITLIVSSFVVCILYIIYRQLHRRSLDVPNVLNSSRTDTPDAPMVDLDQKPNLWDVFIERGRLELEWHRFKPLSTVVLDTMPTAPSTQDSLQGSSKEVEETLRVSVIVLLPSQRSHEPGDQDRKEVDDWAVGITAVRRRGFTPNT